MTYRAIVLHLCRYGESYYNTLSWPTKSCLGINTLHHYCPLLLPSITPLSVDIPTAQYLDEEIIFRYGAEKCHNVHDYHPIKLSQPTIALPGTLYPMNGCLCTQVDLIAFHEQ